jgi:beta-mannanase/glucose/arabinose dehydrogenase
MKQIVGWSFKLRYVFIVMLVLAAGIFFKSTLVTATPSWPPGFSSEPVVTGLASPTAIAWAPDGRMFIALKHGKVLVFENGRLLPTPFIDISAQVNSYWDHGLLGMAVHPGFPNPPYVYLLFTYDPPDLPGAPFADDGSDGAGERVSRLIRVSASITNTNVADPASEVVLLGTNSTLANIGNVADKGGASGIPSCEKNGTPVEDCLPSDGPSHGADTVAFGNDGSLYVSHGEGTPFYSPDPRALRALNLDSLAGKILRINPINGQGYPDNPFYDGDPNHNRSKVWSYGLRQPFRLAVHPMTNELFIGNVGWYLWEELVTGKGKNFGWPCYEGDNTSSARQPNYESNFSTQAACAALYAQGPGAVQAPLYAYPTKGEGHEGGAIIVGDFYQGTTYPPEYQGALFIADYDRNWIRYLTFDTNGHATVHNFAEDISDEGGPVQLVVGPDKNLYYVLFKPGNNSEIRRIRYTPGGNTPPMAKASAAPTNGLPPLTVAFSSAESSDPDGDQLTYKWAFGDTATSTSPNPTHTYTISGTYTAVMTVTDSRGASSTDSVMITVGNRAPTATITMPIGGTTYNIGDAISFSGTGTDVDEGVLPDKNLEWQVLLHHNEHIHYDFFHAIGSVGSFVIPEHGSNTWLELCLTVTDSGGLQDTKCVELHPNPTEHIDLGAYLDGTPYDGFAALQQFESLVNHRMKYVMWSQAWGDDDRDFPTQWIELAAQKGTIPVITWEPWRRDFANPTAVQPAYSLNSIASGEHDEYIRSWAKGAKSVGAPIIIRFAHQQSTEPGTKSWYPWQGDPEGYIAAYRHIVALFRQEGVKNVQFLWSAMWLNQWASQYYPGEDVVDLVGTTVLNYGIAPKTDWAKWQTFDELFSDEYQAALQWDKPIMIAELASAEQGGDKAAWLRDCFTALKSRYPLVQGVLLLEVQSDSTWPVINWSVASSPESLAAFKQAINDPYFTTTPLPVSTATPMPTVAPTPISTGRPMPTATRLPAQTNMPVPKPMPTLNPAGHVGLGAYLDGTPYDGFAAVQQFESLVNHKMQYALWFQAWGNDDRAFPTDWIEMATQKGLLPVITWEPWQRDFANPTAVQPAYSLSSIAAGEHDEYIRSWAKGAKSVGVPIIIRFAHEQSTEPGTRSWYPWQGDPEGYKAAYRHIVALFRQEGAKNVQFLWSAMWLNQWASQYYPGEDVVDLVGTTVLNHGTAPTVSWAKWRTFDELFSGQYQAALQWGKPIMLTELATAEQGGDKAAWLRDCFTSLKPSYPLVQGILLFEVQSDREWPNINWSVASSQESLAAFKQAINDPYFK